MVSTCCILTSFLQQKEQNMISLYNIKTMVKQNLLYQLITRLILKYFIEYNNNFVWKRRYSLSESYLINYINVWPTEIYVFFTAFTFLCLSHYRVEIDFFSRQFSQPHMIYRLYRVAKGIFDSYFIKYASKYARCTMSRFFSV